MCNFWYWLFFLYIIVSDLCIWSSFYFLETFTFSVVLSVCLSCWFLSRRRMYGRRSALDFGFMSCCRTTDHHFCRFMRMLSNMGLVYSEYSYWDKDRCWKTLTSKILVSRLSKVSVMAANTAPLSDYNSYHLTANHVNFLLQNCWLSKFNCTNM